MREFTKEMLDKLSVANESVKGTRNYQKYYMSITAKSEKTGKWFHTGYYIPFTTGTFRKSKDNLYIITVSGDRYEVTDEVKKLLDIN